MNQLYLRPIYLLIIFVIVACGKRTAPVPYEQPELLLPKIKIQQPNYLGNWLRISWEIDSLSGDDKADTFILKVFQQAGSCRYCQVKPIDTIEFSTKGTDQEGSILLRLSEDRYSVLLKETIHKRWQTEDLHYFTLGYRLQSGLNSEDSDKIWPVRAEGIPKPNLSIIKQDHDNSSGNPSIILQWTKQIERIYRTVHGTNTGREITQYYGINLYQSDQPRHSILAEKLNERPLLSGFANISFQKNKLYAAQVDRFGNESERVLIAENAPGNQ